MQKLLERTMRANDFRHMDDLENGNDPQQPPTFRTTYNAIGPTRSSIKVTAPELPIDLHQMIVWIMHHQESAVYLLPKYKELRELDIAHAEAQKTHCGQDI